MKYKILYFLDKVLTGLIITFAYIYMLLWHMLNEIKSLFNKEFKKEWDEWKNEW